MIDIRMVEDPKILRWNEAGEMHRFSQ
jgi:hypothetical protein